MTFVDKYANLFKRLLPGPFTIAVLLTVFTFLLAWTFTDPRGETLRIGYAFHLAGLWEEGLWNRGLLVFAFQMMLMLILGHVLALTKPVENLINYALKFCTDTPRAAVMVTLLTVIVSLFNWGLGLIFGAIFARKVAEHSRHHNLGLNYPLIGAAGYSGLMVWHGGISGSSLVKVAETGHLNELMSGIYSESKLDTLPYSIPFDLTVFSTMNIVVMLALIVILPAGMYFMAKKAGNQSFTLAIRKWDYKKEEDISGADTLNYSNWIGRIFGILILIGVVARIGREGGLFRRNIYYT